MLLILVLIVLERAKSTILANGNFREFFLWREGAEDCVFKTGIPGGPGYYAVKVIQGHPVWYQSKAHMRFPISDSSYLAPFPR